MQIIEETTKIETNNSRRNERAKVAEKHTQLMNLLYKQNIEHSVAETTIYERAFKEGELAIREKADTEFIFIHADTTSAIFEYAGKLQPIESNKTSVKEDKPNENAEEVRTVEESENAEGTGGNSETTEEKVAALSFASWKNPGGGYIVGSTTQEESLCMDSDLYNVLLQFEEEYYIPNRKKTNDGLYYNKGLYSPDIVFMKSGVEKQCDIITVSAPNRKHAVKERNLSEKDNENALRQRCELVLAIAEDQKVTTLILGAFGCGVFEQEPKKVAKIFKELLTTKYTAFKKVIFAVIGRKSGNYDAFKEEFGE